MSVGLVGLPVLHPIPGIRLGTTATGLREPGRRDLVVIECAPGTTAAAVFTRNRFCAVPVALARKHLSQAAPRALLINTGYANAGTGAPGLEDAISCCQALGKALHCTPVEILPFSTGIIGEQLPVDKILAGLPTCVANLQEAGWAEAAAGIMTTDTVPKGCSHRVAIGSHTVTITGIVKGAGMIRPDMATMLAFVATDAKVASQALQKCITAVVSETFNRITVDGDTSTNDACVLLATGKAQNPEIEVASGAAFVVFARAVSKVFAELAQAIIRDAEGATKFITIDVTDGASEADCLEVAYTIAHSPLVKTAFFASDPNWGRLLAAVGRANAAKLKVDAVSIYLNDVCVVSNGALAEDYSETRGQAVMDGQEIHVRVSLGAGTHKTRIWTSDLSQEYVRINAEYRT